MKNKNFKNHKMVSALSVLIGVLILLTVLQEFNKDYPKYLFFVFICIRIILFIKAKIEQKITANKKDLKNA